MRVRITGGPHTNDIRIVNVETGENIASTVTAFEVKGDARKDRLIEATLTVLAELDLEAEVPNG